MADKVSNISVEDVAMVLHLDEAIEVPEIREEIENYIEIAKEYISDYTGQKDLDGKKAFVEAVYVLVQNMYDNKSMTVEKASINPVLENILGMHSVNLL